MTAREKIEELNNSWYGFAVFSALVSLLHNGIGIFSLIMTVFSTVVSFIITWFLGGRLLARSSFFRALILFFSCVGTVFGVLGVAKLGAAFLANWSFGGLLMIVLAAGAVFMHVRTFRVLTDSSVKSYFG